MQKSMEENVKLLTTEWSGMIKSLLKRKAPIFIDGNNRKANFDMECLRMPVRLTYEEDFFRPRV